MAKSKPEKKPKRVTVDVSEIEDDMTNFAEKLGIPEDIWDAMPDSQKLLTLAKRGIKLSLDALHGESDDD